MQWYHPEVYGNIPGDFTFASCVPVQNKIFFFWGGLDDFDAENWSPFNDVYFVHRHVAT